MEGKWSNYCDREQLAIHIKEAQETGTINSKLLRLLLYIARTAWAHLKRTHPKWGRRASWQDARQQCILRTLLILPRLSPDGNLFSYLTTTYLNCIRMLGRKSRNYSRTLRRYYNLYKSGQI